MNNIPEDVSKYPVILSPSIMSCVTIVLISGDIILRRLDDNVE
jgi:hypothetical protein